MKKEQILINAENLTGDLSRLYGDAKNLSGEVSSALSGYVSNELSGIISRDLTGVIQRDLKGSITCLEGQIKDLTGELTPFLSGNLTGVTGVISGLLTGHISGSLVGDFTGVFGTISNIAGVISPKLIGGISDITGYISPKLIGDMTYIQANVKKTSEGDIADLTERETLVYKTLNERMLQSLKQYDNIKDVKSLVEQGADPLYKDSYSLVEAADSGDPRVIRYLLSLGAVASGNNSAALILSSGEGDYEIVSLLIEAGAKPSDQESKSLYLAVMFGELGTCKLLIEKGADVNARKGDILTEAVKQDDFEMVKLLLECGADVADKHLVSLGNSDIFKLFIEHLNSKGYNKKDYLRRALDHGDIELINTLVENGIVSTGDSSPIFIDIVKILIANELDFNEEVKKAIAICVKQNKSILADYLRKQLALLVTSQIRERDWSSITSEKQLLTPEELDRKRKSLFRIHLPMFLFSKENKI